MLSVFVKKHWVKLVCILVLVCVLMYCFTPAYVTHEGYVFRAQDGTVVFARIDLPDESRFDYLINELHYRTDRVASGVGNLSSGSKIRTYTIVSRSKFEDLFHRVVGYPAKSGVSSSGLPFIGVYQTYDEHVHWVAGGPHLSVAKFDVIGQLSFDDLDAWVSDFYFRASVDEVFGSGKLTF